MTSDQQLRKEEENLLAADEPESLATTVDPSLTLSARRLSPLVLLLAGGVVLFAFLASSFAVSNSDFWSHLAAGRLLIHGQHEFVREPFAGPTETGYGTNPSWLFDGLLYLVYTAVGGPGLLVLKALPIVALAWLLLRLPRSDQGGGWPAACTMLVLLILSPHLSLQPTNFSYLFLGVMLWLLARPLPVEEQKAGGSFRCNLKRFWLLPFLVALWSNVDSGFFLGLLLIGLFWLGERLVSLTSQAQANMRPRKPAWLPLACLSACLVNPHHVYVLTIPAEFSPGVIAADDDARRLLCSPWRWGGNAGFSLAEAAYFALIGLGLFSFFLNRHHLAGWRLAVWIGFAVPSAWRTGLVPFFAVVAGPITALNMQDFLSRRREAARTGTNRRHIDWPWLARFLLPAPALGLVLWAGAGRLRGMHGEQRPICWRVQPDPSVQRLAETIGIWQQQGRLHDGERLLAFNPSVAHYFAWFCPAAELRCPHRFQSREEAAVFAEARRELGCQTEDGDHCSRVLREWNIVYAIVEEADNLDTLIERPRQWLLVDVEGRAAIFAWRNAGPMTNVLTPWDANRMAFAPAEEDRDAPPPAAQGPGRGPTTPSFWSSIRPVPLLSWESEAAATYLRFFYKGELPRYSQRRSESWSVFAASLIGSASPAAPAPTGIAPLLVRLHHSPSFLDDVDRGLPALPLLAIRAARRALAANPDDAHAYLRLGQAYLALREQTGERPLSRGNTLLLELRHVQTITALQQAVLRDPDCLAAHHLLGRLYSQRSYLDTALDHCRAELRLAYRAGPLRGEDAETFQERLRSLERQVGDLGAIVEQRQTSLDASSRKNNADPVPRAKTALALGLARRALQDILWPVPPVLLESSGLQLELQLMLRSGLAEQLRDSMLDPQWQQDQANLGWLDVPAPRVAGYPSSYHLPAYAWTRLCWAAAVGDYDRAEDQVQDLLEQLRNQRRQQSEHLLRGLAYALAAEVALSSQGQTLFLQPVLQDGRLLLMSSLTRISSFRGDQADLHVLGGLLAVERGLPRLAEHHLEQARTMYAIQGDGQQEFSTQALADSYLQRIRADHGSAMRGRN